MYHDGISAFFAYTYIQSKVQSTLIIWYTWKGDQTMPAINSQLTHREREVLCLLAAGHTDRKIAESLTISPRTVNRHMSNIFVKLDVPGRAAAAVQAVRRGLI